MVGERAGLLASASLRRELCLIHYCHPRSWLFFSKVQAGKDVAASVIAIHSNDVMTMVAFYVVILSAVWIVSLSDASSIERRGGGASISSFVSPPVIITSSSPSHHFKKLHPLHEKNNLLQHQDYSLTTTREAAGISPGIGLWKDLRQRIKRRGIVHETVRGIRTRYTGRRRRKLSSRCSHCCRFNSIDISLISNSKSVSSP